MSEVRTGQIDPLHYFGNKECGFEERYALAVFERVIGPKVWKHHARRQREINPDGFENYFAHFPYTLSVIRVIPTPEDIYPTRAYNAKTDNILDSVLVVGLGQYAPGGIDGSNAYGISVPYRTDEIKRLTYEDMRVINQVWEICQRRAPWEQDN